MHFFVTGATGFIGGHFLNSIFENGHTATALKRQSSHPKISLIKQPIWCTGDLSDDWSDHLRKCDTLIHLASAGVNTKMNDWDHCFEINVVQSMNLWKLAIQNGIKNLLICGSCYEYGKSGEEYEYLPETATQGES